jgi:hypothetical protein
MPFFFGQRSHSCTSSTSTNKQHVVAAEAGTTAEPVTSLNNRYRYATLRI